MIAAWWLFAGIAYGFEKRPVLTGETVESIAASLGAPALADEIRARNGLAPGAQPRSGQILVLPPPAGPHADQDAFLFSVVGEVTAADPVGSAVPAEAFRALPAGATICTSARSFAGLRVATTCGDDGAAADDVLLDEGTCVVVESAFASVFGRSTLLRVTRGSVTIAAAAAPGRVAVRTDSGLAVGSDGGFRVHADRDEMRSEAVTGAVVLQGAEARLDLAIRTGSRIPLGGDPVPATDLLDPAALAAPLPDAPLLRPRFGWASVDSAFAYRIEIAANAAFTAVVYAETVPEPEHAASMLMLPETAPGASWWRVTAIDRFGYLGVPSETRRFALPPAP